MTTADRFTYGGSTGNQAPTIAQAASASPDPVMGTTANLSVLVADDDGEANLTYTWQATAAPSGASPVFSANGTNAAKQSVVTFDRSGAYSFVVTVKDAGGLTTTSSVGVTVNRRVGPSRASASSAPIRRRSSGAYWAGLPATAG